MTPEKSVYEEKKKKKKKLATVVKIGPGKK
jgi:hypothetical protein